MDMIWKDRKRTFLGLPWSFTKYSLTEERLFIETGFFHSVEDEVRLYRILDLQLSRTLSQKIFGVGSITGSSSDKSMGNFVIKNIKRPKEVKELLSESVEKQRNLKRVAGREYMGDEHGDDMREDEDE